MILAVLGIASAVVPLLVWWIRRRIERSESPEQKHRDEYEKIDADIIGGNSKVATAHASDSLDELERLQRAKGDRSGSTGDLG